MAQRTKDILKTWFETGDKPTEDQFADLIDSFQQSIQNNNVAHLESNPDGSMYFDRLGLVIDVGSGDYDPLTAETDFEYDTQIEGLWSYLEVKSETPFIIQYEASHSGTRQCSAYVIYNEDKIQIRGIMRADFGNNKCCLVTVEVTSSNVRVIFETGYFGSNFGEKDVLGTVLTGLILNPNEAITSKDTILSALGKLQAQITAILKAEPDRYISVSPQSITIPSNGTSQTVAVNTNEGGEWVATERSASIRKISSKRTSLKKTLTKKSK